MSGCSIFIKYAHLLRRQNSPKAYNQSSSRQGPSGFIWSSGKTGLYSAPMNGSCAGLESAVFELSAGRTGGGRATGRFRSLRAPAGWGVAWISAGTSMGGSSCRPISWSQKSSTPYRRLGSDRLKPPSIGLVTGFVGVRTLLEYGVGGIYRLWLL